MTQRRKLERQRRALARFPKSHVSRKGKRTEAQWQDERDRLALSISRNGGA